MATSEQEEIRSSPLGYVLKQILDGDTKLTSPTDFVGDLHDAALKLEAYLMVCQESSDPHHQRVARKLLPRVANLRIATGNKYSVVMDD